VIFTRFSSWRSASSDWKRGFAPRGSHGDWGWDCISFGADIWRYRKAIHHRFGAVECRTKYQLPIADFQISNFQFWICKFQLPNINFRLWILIPGRSHECLIKRSTIFAQGMSSKETSTWRYIRASLFFVTVASRLGPISRREGHRS
jgi:hypothetical protein